jgi:hypothetical protein
MLEFLAGGMIIFVAFTYLYSQFWRLLAWVRSPPPTRAQANPHHPSSAPTQPLFLSSCPPGAVQVKGTSVEHEKDGWGIPESGPKKSAFTKHG